MRRRARPLLFNVVACFQGMEEGARRDPTRVLRVSEGPRPEAPAGILLVDIGAASRAELATRLHGIGVASVGVATSHAEAMELAEDETFDLALVRLEPSTEPEAVATAVDVQHTAGLGVVYWVGKSGQVNLRRARGSAPSGYLFEPVSDEALALTLEVARDGRSPRARSAKRLRLGFRTSTPAGDSSEPSDPRLSHPPLPPGAGLREAVVPEPPEGSEAAFLRVLVERTSELISVFDASGRTIYDSPSLGRLLGYEASPRAGTHGWDWVHPEDRDLVRSTFARVQGSPEPASAEYRIQDSKGGWHTFESVWENHLADPAVRGVVCRSRDITERKELQSQLAQADRLASVGLLAAAVSHEINNSLTYVIGNLESITCGLEHIAATLAQSPPEESISPRQRPAGPTGEPAVVAELALQARQAAEGAQRIANIVNELRAFVRSDADPEKAVSIAAVLDEALTIVDNQIRHHGCRVIKSYEDAAPVFASRNRLLQVFLNLLTNAIQALPEDGESNEIQLSTREEAGFLAAAVRDTGCGIAPESLPRLFDPFFTTKPAGVGTGLGLAISRRIIQAYGGTIEVESELGRGSRFIVRLPIRRPRTSERAISDRPRSTVPATKEVRVLVVDDDPLIGSLMKRMLAREHYVVVVQSVNAAKQMLRDDSFDVIVCDVMMPDASGTSLYDFLVGAYPDLAPKTVFATGGAFTENARRFFERVNNVRLDKPFDGKQLRRAIAEAVGRSSLSSKPPAADGGHGKE